MLFPLLDFTLVLCPDGVCGIVSHVNEGDKNVNLRRVEGGCRCSHPYFYFFFSILTYANPFHPTVHKFILDLFSLGRSASSKYQPDFFFPPAWIFLFSCSLMCGELKSNAFWEPKMDNDWVKQRKEFPLWYSTQLPTQMPVIYSHLLRILVHNVGPLWSTAFLWQALSFTIIPPQLDRLDIWGLIFLVKIKLLYSFLWRNLCCAWWTSSTFRWTKMWRL